MIPKSFRPFLFLTLLSFSCTGRAISQQSNVSAQPSANLARDLLAPLALQIKDNAQQIGCKPGKCKIAVTDFIFTGKGVTPFGIQLADLLSQELSKHDFTVVDRTKVQNLIQRERLSPLSLRSLDVARWLGIELKADAIINADLAKIDDKTIEFSARVLRAGGENKGLSVKGRLHVDLSRVDLSSLGDLNGLPSFGNTFNGQTLYTAATDLLPFCSYMPNPPYTEQARQAHISGAIIVEAIVEPNGRLSNMWIIQGLPGLNQVTLKTMATWRCKAPIREGKPVPVVVPFEVNFRLNQ
ncbi:MAG: TonB family protein [Candidatus Acidiferrales bacterium]